MNADRPQRDRPTVRPFRDSGFTTIDTIAHLGLVILLILAFSTLLKPSFYSNDNNPSNNAKLVLRMRF